MRGSFLKKYICVLFFCAGNHAPKFGLKAKCLTKEFNFVPGSKIALKPPNGQLAGKLFGHLFLVCKVERVVKSFFRENSLTTSLVAKGMIFATVVEKIVLK